MAEKAKLTLFKAREALVRLAKLNAAPLKSAVLMLILGLTPIGGTYPFGWAYYIACGGRDIVTLLPLLLCCAVNGTLLSGAVLSAGLFAIKKLLSPSENRPLVKVGVAACAAVFLCFTELDSNPYGIALRVICAAALPCYTLLYGLYRSQKQGTNAHFASVCAFTFTLTLFINHAVPLPFVSRVAALLITLHTAREGGMLYGGFLGFVCGLAVDSATGAMLGICGLTSGLLFTVSDYLALPIGCLAGLCTGMHFLGAEKVPSLILCFVLAIILFFALKNKLSILKASDGAEEKASDESSPLPLSEAFFAISQSARIASLGENGAERAADDYASFSSLLAETKKRQEEEETVDSKLSAAATHMLCGAGLRAESVRVIGNRKKRLEADNVVIDTLNLSSDGLSELVSELTGTKMRPPEFYLKNGKAALYMESAPRYRIECSRTGVCKSGERISGDTVSFFTSNDGVFFALISDGMGSGKEAAVSSRLASVFLEKLLAAGASRQSALSLLNSYLASRENEVFATVDLFEADLYTGKGVIVKAGAAPSFVLRGGRCKRLQSATAPAGIIREVRAEQLSFSLKGGDMLVMLSDGLAGDGTGSEAEAFLNRLVREESTADIANTLMDDAIRRFGKQDDMSVCVIKILAA